MRKKGLPINNFSIKKGWVAYLIKKLEHGVTCQNFSVTI